MTEDIKKMMGSEGGYGTSPPRLDQYSMFLHENIPEGIEPGLRNILQLLFSKSISIGNIDKADMMANNEIVWAIEEFVFSYQLDSAMMLGIWYINDIKSSMSKDAKLLDTIGRQELKYSQDQHIYEHDVQQKKKGIFRRG